MEAVGFKQARHGRALRLAKKEERDKARRALSQRMLANRIQRMGQRRPMNMQQIVLMCLLVTCGFVGWLHVVSSLMRMTTGRAQ